MFKWANDALSCKWLYHFYTFPERKPEHWMKILVSFCQHIRVQSFYKGHFGYLFFITPLIRIWWQQPLKKICCKLRQTVFLLRFSASPTLNAMHTVCGTVSTRLQCVALATYSSDKIRNSLNWESISFIKILTRECERVLSVSTFSGSSERTSHYSRTKLHRIFYEWWRYYPQEWVSGRGFYTGWSLISNLTCSRPG